MKKFLLIVLTIVSVSCNGQENNEVKTSNGYVVTYKKDGKSVTDTVSFQDKNIAEELNRMISDPNYKPANTQNDTVFNADGEPTQVKLSNTLFGATFQTFKYDSLGYLISITGYDNKNSIKAFYHDIAIQLNTYDENGNLVEIRNLGEDNQLISSAFEDTPIIRMKYNDNNQLVEEWYLDENENLRSEFAINKFSYDEQGKKISEGWFNEKGERK